MCWLMLSIPSVQAYHAVGSQVTLCAICAPQPPSSKPYVVDLAVADLRLTRERIKHLRRIIRLSRYIPLLPKLVGYRRDPEFVAIKRCGPTC